MANAVKVRVEVPDSISPGARQEAELKAREAAVLALWRAGEVSSRQAAAELDLGYHEFLDLLEARGMPVEEGIFNADAAREAAQPYTPNES